jgi:hypothetical protein
MSDDSANAGDVVKMIDALFVQDIPTGTTCDAVAAYIDHVLNPSSFTQAVAMFPNAQHVKITVTGVVGADVLDCELTTLQPKPSQAVAWVRASRAAGYDPAVYCNQLNTYDGLQPLKAAFSAAAVAEPHWWVANYDLNPTIPAGCAAKQYTDRDPNGNNTYDTSSTVDYWPRPTPKPVSPVKDDDMPIIINAPDSVMYVLMQGKIIRIAGPAEVNGPIQAAPTWKVGATQWSFLLQTYGAPVTAVA